MDSRTLRIAVAALAALVLLATPSAPAAPPVPPLVTNGDFENAAISPWVAGAGMVQLVDDSVWTPAGGHKSLSLYDEGWVYQDIATTPGQRYDLSLAATANPINDGFTIGCSPGTKDMTVWWGDTAAAGYQFDTTGHTTASMGWQTKHLLVDATAATTRLRIDDYLDPGCGVALDNVALTAPSAGQTGVRLTTPSSFTVFGEPLELHATVLGSSAAVTPTGSVQFEIDGEPAGPPVPLQGGAAQTSVNDLVRNGYIATATYLPDSGSFTTSTVTQRVHVLQALTSTGVTFDAADVPLDQPVTVTAHVGVFSPGTGTPAGTIQFMDESGYLGDPVPLEPDGTAQIELLEDVGDHVIQAWYSGDIERYTTSSGQGDLSVYDPNAETDPPPANPPPAGTRLATTTTAVASSKNPTAPGESYVVTATVSPRTPNNAALGGTVQLRIGTTNVGGPTAVDPNRSATFTLTAPAAAERQTISAIYSGDARFSRSTGTLSQRTLAVAVPVVLPPPLPLILEEDTVVPEFTLTSRTVRLGRAMRSGLRVHVACDEKCSAVLKLTAKIGRKTVVVARGRRAAADAPAFDVVVRFVSRYRKQLAKTRKLALRLDAMVEDGAGNRSVRVKKLTLKR